MYDSSVNVIRTFLLYVYITGWSIECLGYRVAGIKSRAWFKFQLCPSITVTEQKTTTTKTISKFGWERPRDEFVQGCTDQIFSEWEWEVIGTSSFTLRNEELENDNICSFKLSIHITFWKWKHWNNAGTIPRIL